MSASKKITPLTGDPQIDAWTKMRNRNIKNQRTRAPRELTANEQKLLFEYLSARDIGVGRIIAANYKKATYIRIRIRNILSGLGWGDYIGTSVQDNTVIAWRYEKYNGVWRITQPLDTCPMYVDAQNPDVTLYQDDYVSPKSDADVVTILQKGAKEAMEATTSANQTHSIRTSAMKQILNDNLKNGIITQEDYDEAMMQLEEE